MTSLTVRFLITVFGILLVSKFVPGIAVSGLYIAVIVAIVWGLINITLRPILFVLTLPITILTLGLFTLVINALLFWFMGTFIQGFEVEGFLPALLGTLIISVISFIGSKFT